MSDFIQTLFRHGLDKKFSFTMDTLMREVHQYTLEKPESDSYGDRLLRTVLPHVHFHDGYPRPNETEEDQNCLEDVISINGQSALCYIQRAEDAYRKHLGLPYWFDDTERRTFDPDVYIPYYQNLPDEKRCELDRAREIAIWSDL